jgi:hypothetical protein
MTLTKIKPLDTIKYNVFRGHLEPVIEQRKCEVNFYPNYMELIQDYTFKPYEPEPDDCDYRRFATTTPKSGMTVELTEHYRSSDPDKTTSPIIYIHTYGKIVDSIQIETMDEAYNIYNKIKHWLNG